ncbi:50S ribosomal protein L23 [Candidatus Haliotispira prima]|uniref:Large ribosomal subunit protein uL23 n=1 Tax=Candidatus Haliotispira prima TaxID=3034016 RepID=A0ABY8MFZ4_9SPIO|nr:50S ribosomal protein L23 [Candidatus Haliotispira prima]
MEVEEILICPLLTEKTSMLQAGVSGYRKYSFRVDVRANKFEILYAVRKLFNVEPLSCNIVSVKSKKKRNLPISKKSFQRGHGKTAPWKKAIVTLPKGQSIEALESLNVNET